MSVPAALPECLAAPSPVVVGRSFPRSAAKRPGLELKGRPPAILVTSKISPNRTPAFPGDTP